MTKLPDELQGYYSVNVPIDPNVIRFGAYEGPTHLKEQTFLRQVMSSKLKFVHMQHLYAKSFVEAETVTLMHMKDILLSIALGLMIRSTQTRDASGTQLTKFASTFWESAEANSFINNDLVDYQASLANGTLGSLLFEVTKQSTPYEYFDNPVDLLDSHVKTFWQSAGLSKYAAPAINHSKLLDRIFSQSTLNLQGISDAFTKYWYLEPDDVPLPMRNFLRILRQELQSPPDWQFLKQRFIVGEINESIVDAYEALQAEANQPGGYELTGLESNDIKSLRLIYDRTFKVFPPSGMNIAYIAFAVDGLVKSCKRLINLAQTEDNLAWSDFIDLFKYESIRLELARDLGLTYDALSALAFFNSINEARSLSNQIYVIAAQLVGNTELPAEGDTRLYSFL